MLEQFKESKLYQEVLISKKFYAALGTILALINVDLSPEAQMQLITAVGAVYIAATGIQDGLTNLWKVVQQFLDENK